ncbi:MAG: ABC transporter permease [Promethearchaeota archaeon]
MFAPVSVLCCGIIAGDREKGTLKIYASKPVYRTQLVLIRFLAFALISLLFTAIVYFCMYLVYAISIFGKMNLIIAGIAETIDMPINLTLLTWLFILATGSITTLMSSLLNRAVFAAIVSLTLLFGLSMLIGIMMVFVGALAEPLKYMDLTAVIYSLMNEYILGFVFWDALFDVIIQYGYTDVVTTMFLGQLVDSTAGMIEFLCLVIFPLVAACIITEKREIH